MTSFRFHCPRLMNHIATGVLFAGLALQSTSQAQDFNKWKKDNQKPAGTEQKIQNSSRTPKFEDIAKNNNTPEKAWVFAQKYLVRDMLVTGAMDAGFEVDLARANPEGQLAMALFAGLHVPLDSLKDADLGSILNMKENEKKIAVIAGRSLSFEMKNKTIFAYYIENTNSHRSETIHTVPTILQTRRGACESFSTLIGAILQKNGYETYIVAMPDHNIVLYKKAGGLWGTSGMNTVDVQASKFASINDAFSFLAKKVYPGADFDMKPPYDVFAYKLPAEVYSKTGTLDLQPVWLMHIYMKTNGTAVYENKLILK